MSTSPLLKGQGCLPDCPHCLSKLLLFYKKIPDKSLYSHWLVKIYFFCIIQLAECMHASPFFLDNIYAHLLYKETDVLKGESAWLKPSSVKLDEMIGLD